MKKFLIGLFCLEVAFIVHEGAHFVLMRANGMEVEEASLGIGPVLYQKQFPEFKFSVRLIPIMAYVMPSKKGIETERTLPLLNIILIDLAGVFVNLALASLVFLVLKLKESSQSWLTEFLFSPINYFRMFKSALVSMLTLKSVKPQYNGALILETSPGLAGRYLLQWNLMLGILNLLPAQMLDGGKVFFIFLAMALDWIGVTFGISGKTLAIVLEVINMATFWMLFMIIIYGLDEPMVKIEKKSP